MTPDMELALTAQAENIAVVRYALGGLGEAFAVSESKLSDIRLAVTEACANVVVHAYPDGHRGPMEVIASKDEDTLTVLVRDWGRGIGPRSGQPWPRPRPVVDCGARRQRAAGPWRHRAHGGTDDVLAGRFANEHPHRAEHKRIRGMTIEPGHAYPFDSLDAETLDGPTVTESISDEPEPAKGNFARVRLADGPLAGPVLWRVVSMMLARADWPLDRLDDMLLVCDALSAHAFAHSSDTTVTFSIQAGKHDAELRVLDLVGDGASSLIKDAVLPVVGNVLERIAERVSTERHDHCEGSQLVLALRARSPAVP